jgi:hypothetical protein
MCQKYFLLAPVVETEAFDQRSTSTRTVLAMPASTLAKAAVGLGSKASLSQTISVGTSGVGFMKPIRPKFINNTRFSQIYYDLVRL